jgi:hypothetical protein
MRTEVLECVYNKLEGIWPNYSDSNYNTLKSSR